VRREKVKHESVNLPSGVNFNTMCQLSLFFSFALTQKCRPCKAAFSFTKQKGI